MRFPALLLALLCLPGLAEEDRLREAAERALLQDASELRRLCTVTVRVRDAQGRPVAGLAMDGRVDEPEFALGAEIRPGFAADPADPSLRVFQGQFTRALLNDGLRWKQWEESKPAEAAEVFLRGLVRLRTSGVTVLGNALVWPGWHRKNPPGLSALSEGDLQNRIISHVTRLAGAFRKEITDWDVVTQPRIDHDFLDRLGEPAAAAWFRAAEAAAPGVRLGFSEFGLLTAGEESLKETETRLIAWRKAGANPSVLRIQATPVAFPTLALLKANLDRLARIGLALEITDAGPSATANAEQTSDSRLCMVVLLGHPAVKAVYVNSAWESGAPQMKEFLSDLSLPISSLQSGATDAQGEWTVRLPRGTAHFTLRAASGPLLRSTELDRARQEFEIRLTTPALPSLAKSPAAPKPAAKTEQSSHVSAIRAREEARWLRENPPPPPGPLNLDKLAAPPKVP